MLNLTLSCAVVTKEELFDKMSNAVSYYHALELFNSSGHIVLSISERVKLLNTANSRLRDLRISGITLGDENDPYKQSFYGHVKNGGHGHL